MPAKLQTTTPIMILHQDLKLVNQSKISHRVYYHCHITVCTTNTTNTPVIHYQRHCKSSSFKNEIISNICIETIQNYRARGFMSFSY